jgi:tripartite-type tricarboxylate transporter receptor subunit TctC
VDKAQFDSRKFTWLGSVTDDDTICVSSAASRIKNWDDFLSTPSKFGGEGVGGEPDSWLLMYRNVFGAKSQLVTGYPGTNDIMLAMDRGEVDGLCGLSWSTVKTQRPHWLTDHSVNFLVQAALQKEPALASTPLATDLAKTPEQLQILKLLLVTEAMARPFAAPPDMPPDRKAALLSAFDGTMSDPDFLAEAQKLNFDVRPVGAAKIDALLADVYNTPKDVIDRAKKAITSEGQ